MKNSVTQRSSFAPRAHNVLGEKCRQIRLFTSVVQKRFGKKQRGRSWQRESRNDRAGCAMTQARSLRYKLQQRAAPRIAKRRSVTASLKNVLTAEVGEDSTEAEQIKNLRLLRESLWPNYRRSSMMVIGNEK